MIPAVDKSLLVSNSRQRDLTEWAALCRLMWLWVKAMLLCCRCCPSSPLPDAPPAPTMLKRNKGLGSDIPAASITPMGISAAVSVNLRKG